MKVLLISINYDPEPTGIAPYVAGLARGLAAAGHEIHVITGVPHYPFWRNYTGFRGRRHEGDLDGVHVTRVRHYIPQGGIGWRRALMELTFGIAVTAERWHSPDVVLTVSPPLISSGMALLKSRMLWRSPVTAVWSQDLYTSGLAALGREDSPKARFGHRLEGVIYRGVDEVIVIGENFRKFVARRLHVPEERIALHGNWSHVLGAKDDRGWEIRRRLGWDSRTVILHVGNMGKKQGLETVVDSAKLADEEGQDLLFVLMGDGSERARLEASAKGCGSLSFVDPLPDDDFSAALDAADIFLINERPGVGEMAVPSKLTTYFRAGKPVLAAVSQDSNAAALVAEAGAGVIVQPGSGRSLLDSALLLAADSDRRWQCGEAARNYAELHMGSEAAISGLVAGLERLVSIAANLVASDGMAPTPDPIGPGHHSLLSPDYSPVDDVIGV